MANAVLFVKFLFSFVTWAVAFVKSGTKIGFSPTALVIFQLRFSMVGE